MFQSIRSSQIALRVCLAVVFLWFGLAKFIEPQSWEMILRIPSSLVFLIGIFDVILAVALASGFFMRSFAGVELVFLIVLLTLSGLDEYSISTIGLMGGLLALILWPDRSYA
jgi:uncharacterized membrane protein YphA (DoxX/SURF4 family)